MKGRESTKSIRVTVGKRGTLVIPKVFREALHIADDTDVLVRLENNSLVIKKPARTGGHEALRGVATEVGSDE